ncbi:hypothetical protein HIM_00157 [Hirsutella minnesotensis 3608]|nr:hypothetical protein HIM_00157 [Hirsutella minnesotensis 3608]
MAPVRMESSSRTPKHPYFTGNFQPIRQQFHQQPCPQVIGAIPPELSGGQFVRNGGNELAYTDTRRARHWFDAHGMLCAVYFRPADSSHGIVPLYSNCYVLTDIYLAERQKETQQRPLLPSITTMLDSSFHSRVKLLQGVPRLLWTMGVSSWKRSMTPIRRISVANTNIIHHDGRVLALCESGPPLRVQLPGLETVGWFDGSRAQGETELTGKKEKASRNDNFIGKGLLGFFRGWTLAHPHIDPMTGEMLLVHNSIKAPFCRYSVIAGPSTSDSPSHQQLFGQPIPGVSSPKMMHDFGASRRYSVIIDVPLSLNPFNIITRKPIISYNAKGRMRFGVFPRHSPELAQWCSTEACCIFHTVNTWDESMNGETRCDVVHMLVCRFPCPSILYSAGNLPIPDEITGAHRNLGDTFRLYYYRLTLDESGVAIEHQWALSAIAFELPRTPQHLSMSSTRYVYGCWKRSCGNEIQAVDYVKFSGIAKIDVRRLIAKGLESPPAQISGCVDERSIDDIIASRDPNDPIQVFELPRGWSAQECAFVPRESAASEDDGWLLTYVCDESQFIEGEARDDAQSELWIIDARSMRNAVARIRLPQRVPSGFHGDWFSHEVIARQRSVAEFRSCR